MRNKLKYNYEFKYWDSLEFSSTEDDPPALFNLSPNWRNNTYVSSKPLENDDIVPVDIELLRNKQLSLN